MLFYAVGQSFDLRINEYEKQECSFNMQLRDNNQAMETYKIHGSHSWNEKAERKVRDLQIVWTTQETTCISKKLQT